MREQIMIISLVLLLVIVCCIGLKNNVWAATNDSNWSSFPFRTTEAAKYKYMYVVGGYHSIDDGSPAWGTADNADVRFIGEKMGEIIITYKDGSEDIIPLTFGYTMWYYNIWSHSSLPFKGENANPGLQTALKSVLHLKGAYEGEDKCVFKVKLQDKEIKSIVLEDNKQKNGNPIFDGIYLTNDNTGVLSGGKIIVNTSDKFFDSHTIDSLDPYPDSVAKTLDSIIDGLMTKEEEYLDIPEFYYPNNHEGSYVYFSGTPLANAATGILYTNLKSMVDRTAEDGLMHESYKDAPAWRQSFGAYMENAGSFYNTMYTRTARGLMSLISFGQVETAQRATSFSNRWMMYFPENNLKMLGKDIPGHYTVIVNQPMIYSTVLAPGGWPTRYTKELFGDDYQNLGNQETDGHGLTMMANYQLWLESGKDLKWIEDNWIYIKEAAKWITWSFENPDISFARRGLLYAESEAGMMAYTLYCNVPCYFGMLGYAQIAEAYGKTEEAQEWKACAEALYEAITDRLGSDKTGWTPTTFGFRHDPVTVMMADYYGYDTMDMDQNWLSRSRISYEKDITSVSNYDYWGAFAGVGYDHSMMTQSALIMDQMSDATKLMNNLSKLAYMPGLPEPYMIPEMVSVNIEKGIVSRQGDLGNLYQVSDAMKCYSLAIGVSAVRNNTLKLMPRLPENWELDIQNFEIPNAAGTVDLLVTYPKDGIQTAQVTLKETSGFEDVKVRFGPLPLETQVATAQINGAPTSCELVESGDSAWAWVSFKPTEEKQKIALKYGNSVEELPDWPEEWKEANKQPHNSENNNNNGKSKLGLVIGSTVATICLLTMGVTVGIKVKKKKGKREL